MKKLLTKHKTLIFSFLLILVIIGVILFSGNVKQTPQKQQPQITTDEILSGSFDEKLQKSDGEWKSILTQEQYHILREAGTEVPFTGELNSEKRKGTYYSVGCDKPLFRSEQKYDSGTGWPSFYAPLSYSFVKEVVDESLGMVRGEIVCARCGGHLGHVFNDGPKPTGLRYCMDSASLIFQK